MSAQTSTPMRDQRASTETVLPPADPSTVQPLLSFLDTYGQGACLVAPDGVTAEIPLPVLDVLRDVAEAMSRGRAITVAPVSLRLTTTQAADMINVSRPTLIKLLEDGEIPYERPRRHRLLRLDDVLAYQERRRHRTASQLDEITRQAVADGLYGDDDSTYADALQQARSSTD